LQPRPEGPSGSEVIYFPTPAGSQGFWVSVLDLDNTAGFDQHTKYRLGEAGYPLAAAKAAAPKEGDPYSGTRAVS